MDWPVQGKKVSQAVPLFREGKKIAAVSKQKDDTRVAPGVNYGVRLARIVPYQRKNGAIGLPRWWKHGKGAGLQRGD